MGNSCLDQCHTTSVSCSLTMVVCLTHVASLLLSWKSADLSKGWNGVNSEMHDLAETQAVAA